MNFLEYLWYLAHKPLKVKEESKSDAYKFFKPFAKILDKAKEKIFIFRRQALIGTAIGKALDKHGEGRKIKRFPDEDDEAFRRRILAKPKIAKLAGTNRGIKEALKSLGFSDFYIEPMYIYDPERWAEFYIFIDVKDINLVNDFKIVENVVKDVKMASALPNYGLKIKDNNIYIGSYLATGEDIVVYPWSASEISVKGQINIGMANNQNIDTTVIYPKEVI